MKKTQEKSKAGTKPAAKGSKTPGNLAQTESEQTVEQESGRARKPKEKPEAQKPETEKPPQRLAAALRHLNTGSRTRGWMPIYLETLRKVPMHAIAAQAAGVSTVTAWQWRKRNPKFAQQCVEALRIGADMIEAEAYRRAVNGWDKPIFGRENQVSILTTYTPRGDVLTMPSQASAFAAVSIVRCTRI